MTACHSCGAELKTGIRFCPDCGTAVREPGVRPSFGPRYAAFLVDFTIVFGVYFVASALVRPFIRLLPFGNSGEVDLGVFTPNVLVFAGVILFPLVALVYFAVLDGKGASIGKKTVGLRVRPLGADGKPGLLKGLIRSSVSWGPVVAMLIGAVGGVLGMTETLSRFLVGFCTIVISVIWASTIVTAFSRRRRRGLHDLAAGTEVVRG